MDEIFSFLLNLSLEVADKSHSSPSTGSLKGRQESKTSKSKNRSKYIGKITCTNQADQRAQQNPDYRITELFRLGKTFKIIIVGTRELRPPCPC